MTAKRWGLDTPLDYHTCVSLTEGPPLPKGRTLNWSGLRMYSITETSLYPTIDLRKGCASIVQLTPGVMTFLKDHWRGPAAFELMRSLSPLPIGRQDETWYFIQPAGHPRLLVTDGCRMFHSKANVPTVDPEIEWAPGDTDPGVTVWPTFRRYTDAFCAALERKEIGPSDAEMCWDCYFYTSKKIDGQPLPRGCEPSGLTHLFQHAARSEFVPALLWRAIQEMGLNPTLRWDNVVSPRHPDVTAAHEYLSAYFRRRLGSLASYHLLAQPRLQERTRSVESGGSGEVVTMGKTADASPV